MIGFEANIPRLEARRTRKQLQLSSTRISPDALYELVLAETEDEEMAATAMQHLIWNRLKAGEET